MTDLPHAVVELPGIVLAALLIGSVGGALAYPLFRRVIVRCRPAARSLAVLLYGLMAPASAVVVLLLLLQPQYADLLIPGHCHQENCGSHAPLLPNDSVGTLGLVAVAALLSAAALLAIGYGIRLAQRRVRTLTAFAHRPTEADYLLVDTGEPLAWCCGLWRPRIFLSRGLIDCLGQRELAVVIAHEQAHRDRLDNLRAALLAWSTLLWPPRLRRLIRGHMLEDAEHACDEAALEKTGDRRALVSAIEAVGAPIVPGRVARSAAFTCGDGVDRAGAATARPSAFGTPARAWSALGLLWFLQIGATTATSHLVLEWVAALGT